MYKQFFFPILKKLDAEKAHYLAMDALKFACSIPFLKKWINNSFSYTHDSLKTNVLGFEFPNPVGLAAGFDKNALWIDELSTLGFGFIEIGTLTPKGQAGNDKPRLFRLPSDGALINRMGFNNEGVEVAVESLKKRKSKIIVGGNIGKNKVTPNQEATQDYVAAFDKLYPYVDYFVVNVSSPNTPGLRELQEKKPLMALLLELKRRNRSKGKEKPILLKIAPDLSNEQLDDIVEIVSETQISGIIATNTTIDRHGLSTSKEEVAQIGAGGLSGDPIKNRSTEVIRYLSEKSKGNFPIIGVGGIRTGQDALEKLKAGASLVQVYSGFVYEGPAMVKNICQDLVKLNYATKG